MKPYSCRTVLLVLILLVLVFSLDSDDKDYEAEKCITEIKVRRHTVYEALAGQQLRINCTVAFCSSSTTVSWFKIDKRLSAVAVNVSSSSHIKTEWKMLKELKGISFLVFQSILKSDSGVYQCHSEGGVSHNINVSVNSDVELTTVTQTTLDSDNTTTAVNTIIPFVYRLVGVMVLVIIGLAIFITPKRVCKGKSQSTTDPSLEPQHHIYENDC